MGDLPPHGGDDFSAIVIRVHDVVGVQPALLARADVDHRRAEERALLDAGRRVADQARRVTFSSAMNSSTGTSVMKRIVSRVARVRSRKCRRLSAISPVPASAFGQNQIVGMSSAATARSVSSR